MREGEIFLKNKFLNKSAALGAIIILLVSVFAGCSTSSKIENKVESAQRPIIIQGPMPIEAENFAKRLKNVKEETSGSFVFYKGTLDKYPVIVVKTGKGMENTAASTAVAIERYDPIAVINQGTSGGHDPNLNVYDIEIGRASCRERV